VISNDNTEYRESALSNEYFRRLSQGISDLDHEQIARFAREIESVSAQGGTVWIAGNGGSAATASHMAVDMSFGVRPGGKIRAVAISESAASITATGNDVSFEDVFTRQLAVLARQGDLLLVISASGNSLNLIRAVRDAPSLGVKTAALLGFDGGQLASLVDFSLITETRAGDYGVAEDLHLAVNHCIKELLSYGHE
jgi:D-sedoheptulose 7-phosphate isomerase